MGVVAPGAAFPTDARHFGDLTMGGHQQSAAQRRVRKPQGSYLADKINRGSVKVQQLSHELTELEAEHQRLQIQLQAYEAGVAALNAELSRASAPAAPIGMQRQHGSTAGLAGPAGAAGRQACKQLSLSALPPPRHWDSAILQQIDTLDLEGLRLTLLQSYQEAGDLIHQSAAEEGGTRAQAEIVVHVQKLKQLAHRFTCNQGSGLWSSLLGSNLETGEANSAPPGWSRKVAAAVPLPLLPPGFIPFLRRAMEMYKRRVRNVLTTRHAMGQRALELLQSLTSGVQQGEQGEPEQQQQQGLQQGARGELEQPQPQQRGMQQQQQGLQQHEQQQRGVQQQQQQQQQGQCAVDSDAHQVVIKQEPDQKPQDQGQQEQRQQEQRRQARALPLHHPQWLPNHMTEAGQLQAVLELDVALQGVTGTMNALLQSSQLLLESVLQQLPACVLACYLAVSAPYMLHIPSLFEAVLGLYDSGQGADGAAAGGGARPQGTQPDSPSASTHSLEEAREVASQQQGDSPSGSTRSRDEAQQAGAPLRRPRGGEELLAGPSNQRRGSDATVAAGAAAGGLHQQRGGEIQQRSLAAAEAAHQPGRRGGASDSREEARAGPSQQQGGSEAAAATGASPMLDGVGGVKRSREEAIAGDSQQTKRAGTAAKVLQEHDGSGVVERSGGGGAAAASQ